MTQSQYSTTAIVTALVVRTLQKGCGLYGIGSLSSRMGLFGLNNSYNMKEKRRDEEENERNKKERGEGVRDERKGAGEGSKGLKEYRRVERQMKMCKIFIFTLASTIRYSLVTSTRSHLNHKQNSHLSSGIGGFSGKGCTLSSLTSSLGWSNPSGRSYTLVCGVWECPVGGRG